MLNNWNLRLGFLLTSILLLAWMFSGLISSEIALEINLSQKLKAPNLNHWLGTDAFGRDVATLLLLGTHATLTVGVFTVLIGLLIGTSLGLWAAAARGWVQEIIMRLADFTFAFPAILSAIMLSAVFGAGIHNAILAIGIFNIPIFIRVTYAQASTIWARDYVLAARVCGQNHLKITWEHILPNIRSVLLVQATLQFAMAILAEAALSYLGLGTQAPQPSWGRMLGEAQSLMFQAPLLAVFPGLAIACAVLGLNLLGDGLRDVLDPRLN